MIEYFPWVELNRSDVLSGKQHSKLLRHESREFTLELDTFKSEVGVLRLCSNFILDLPRSASAEVGLTVKKLM